MEDFGVMLAQSNALTNARYDFSLYQKRFLYYIIKDVRRLYIDTEQGDKTLFGNMLLRLTPEQLKECGEPATVFREAAELREKTIHIERKNETVSVGWINYVKRDKKSGIYEVEVSKEIMPELVELASRFHTYALTVALSLKSVYSQRMYELCSQYKNYQGGYFHQDVEALQLLLGTPESYKDFGLFRARVLETARKEIKDLYDANESDLFFEYSIAEKKGKKIIALNFSVYTREREKLKTFSPEDAIFFIRTKVATFYRKDKKYIERIVKHIQLHPNLAPELVSKLSSKMNDYPHADIPAIIRYVMSEDYGVR